jgi:hypothetical protein
MAEAATQISSGSLADFLDTLPTSPCPANPQNRYYCTVCERLNKSIAARCKYSNVQGADALISGQEIDKDVTFESPVESKDSTEKKPTDEKSEKVAFKIVAPDKGDKDYPLFEFVQPKDKKIEPIEMELLENVAIEFTTSDDEEAVEVEALEVTPVELDDDELDEESEAGEIVEVEVADAVEFNDDISFSSADDSMMEFKPVGTSSPTPTSGTVVKRKPTAISKKPIKKTHSKLKPKTKSTPGLSPSKKPAKRSPRTKSPTKSPSPKLRKKPSGQPQQTWAPPEPSSPGSTQQPGTGQPEFRPVSPTVKQPTQSQPQVTKKRVQPVNPTIAPTPKKVARIKKRSK